MTTIRIQDIVNKAAENVVNASIMGAVGYFCARFLTAINPIHGAVFCAISTVVSQVVNPIFSRIFANENANNASKFIGSVLSVLTGVGVSAAISSLAGFSISFGAALYLTAAMVAVLALTILGVAAAACVVTATESAV